MRFNIPMNDDEIKMHKPNHANFVDFRAGIRCAERVYQVADLIEQATVNQSLTAKHQNLLDERVHHATASVSIAPPPRQPLTDVQIQAVIAIIDPDEQYLPTALKQFARAIEAAHGIKEENT